MGWASCEIIDSAHPVHVEFADTCEKQWVKEVNYFLIKEDDDLYVGMIAAFDELLNKEDFQDELLNKEDFQHDLSRLVREISYCTLTTKVRNNFADLFVRATKILSLREKKDREERRKREK